MYFELGAKISQLGDDLVAQASLGLLLSLHTVLSAHGGNADAGYGADSASSCLYSSLTCELELTYLLICLIGSEFKS